jgi:hypothetical protein
MALTYGAQGTSSAGTTSCTPTYPAGISATTSELFAIVTGRSSVADTAITGPAGWTSLGQLEGGTGTYGVDTGTRRVAFFRKDTVTGSESGSVSFTLGAGNSQSTLSGTIFRVEKTANYTVSAQFASGADTTNGTAYSATSSTSPTWATGDFLLIGTAQNIDTGTGSSRAVSATGVTFGTLSLWVDAAVVNGNDHRRIFLAAPVSSASTTAAVTFSYTISAAGSGPTAFVVLTETATDVSVGIVGSGMTASSGTVTAPRQNGQSITSAQGSISAVAGAVTLTGSAITGEQGTTTPNSNGTVALTGSASTLAQGSPALDTSKAATGSEATSEDGDLAPNLFPTNINFPTLTLSTGTVEREGGGDVTVHISGNEFTAGSGVVDSGGQPLTGQASTSASGTATPSVTTAISGESMTADIGSITPEQLADDTYIASTAGSTVGSMTVPLVGSEATAEQGELIVTGDEEMALAGEEMTSAAGTLTPSVDAAVTGSEFLGEQNAIGAPGFVALTGSLILVSAGDVFTTNDRDLALTGEAMTAQDGSCFASPLAFVTGASMTIEQSQIGERTFALTGSEVTVSAGDMSAGPKNATGFVLYLPFRAVSGIFSEGGGVDTSVNATTNKTVMPPPNEPLTDQQGRISPSWYRFLEYMFNKKLGGAAGPTMADIAANVESSQAAVTQTIATVTAVSEAVTQNAQVLQATVEVAQNNSLSGSANIPSPRTYTSER